MISDNIIKILEDNGVKKETIWKVRDFMNERAVIVWNIEDVEMVARENNVECSKDQAVSILHQLENSHDAERGVCWGDIEFLLQELNN